MRPARIATKVALPIPKVVGMTATVGGLVWGKDPEELRKINEQRAQGTGRGRRRGEAAVPQQRRVR